MNIYQKLMYKNWIQGGGGVYLETLRVLHKRLFQVLLTVNNKTFIVYSK